MDDTQPSPSGTYTTSWLHSREQKSEIAQKLYTIAEGLGEVIEQNRVEIYLRALCDLPFDRLCTVLGSMVITCRKFPAIPDIREAVAGLPANLVDLEAEAAWLAAYQWVWQNWDPDNGVMAWESPTGGRSSLKPARGEWKPIAPLPPRSEHAIRAVGGYERVWLDIQNDQYTWVKREWIEAWKRAEKVQEILELAAPADRKRLTEGFASAGEIFKAM
jgi:hypothetical protein